MGHTEAPCVGRPAAYFEALYGGRNGYGMLLVLDEQGDCRIEDLWRA